MRKPFKVSVAKDLEWKELALSDTEQLFNFFKDVLDAKKRALIEEDGFNWDDWPQAQKGYENEARSLMFALRGLPDVDVILTRAAQLALPDIIRLFQSSKDETTGIAGYHIGLLWRGAGKEVVGVSVLEKTKNQNEAEISVWKRPRFESAQFHKAVKKYMAWSQTTAGYKDFIAHTEKKTATQRGNPVAIASAIKKFGFEITGTRPANAPNGNGKDTLILTLKNWSPEP